MTGETGDVADTDGGVAAVDGVLPEVLVTLRERGALDAWTVDRVTFGASVVLVELAGRAGTPREGERTAGLAHRPAAEPPTGEDDTPGREQTLSTLLAPVPDPASTPPERAPAVAALNALSAPSLAWRDGDPMAALTSAVSTVVTVGLFRPAFRKFSDVTVRVIERRAVDPATVEAPPGVTVEAFDPDQAEAAMTGADVVFVTGSTLVYGGIEDYLAVAPAAATVVVVGATASTLPGPLFARGADVVAGAAVDDPDRVRAAVEAGQCGTDLHDAGLRKAYVAATAPTGIDLRTDETAGGPPTES